MNPVLSLVTGTLNRRAGYHRLLNSIHECTPVPWELIVADASDGEDYTKNVGPWVHVLPERPRLGMVKGYNRAFAEAKGEWVIWLNDDCEVMPGYAEIAIRFMEHHPEIGLGALYYCEYQPPFKVNKYMGMVYANFGIIRRSLGEAVGWFDDDLTMYGCDNSLTFRVLLAGLGIGSIPGAKIWHHTVFDKEKLDNQKYRTPDEATTWRKYKPFEDRMLKVYNQTRHLAGPLVIGE